MTNNSAFLPHYLSLEKGDYRRKSSFSVIDHKMIGSSSILHSSGGGSLMSTSKSPFMMSNTEHRHPNICNYSSNINTNNTSNKSSPFMMNNNSGYLHPSFYNHTTTTTTTTPNNTPTNGHNSSLRSTATPFFSNIFISGQLKSEGRYSPPFSSLFTNNNSNTTDAAVDYDYENGSPPSFMSSTISSSSLLLSSRSLQFSPPPSSTNTTTLQEFRWEAGNQFLCRDMETLMENDIYFINRNLPAILECAVPMMCEMFGNFLFQAIIKFSNQMDRRKILLIVAPYLKLAINKLEGSRSVQAILDNINSHDINSYKIVYDAVAKDLPNMISHTYSNHIVQRILQFMPLEINEQLVRLIIKDARHFSCGRFSCYVGIYIYLYIYIIKICIIYIYLSLLYTSTHHINNH